MEETRKQILSILKKHLFYIAIILIISTIAYGFFFQN